MQDSLQASTATTTALATTLTVITTTTTTNGTKIKSTKHQSDSPCKKNSTSKAASQIQNAFTKRFYIAGNNGVLMYVF